MSNNQDATKGLTALLSLPLLLGLSALSWFQHGYVAAKVWAWFIVPLGAPVYGWVTFSAVAMLLGLIRPKHPDGYTPTKSDLFYALIRPWLALLVAWILLWGSK